MSSSESQEPHLRERVLAIYMQEREDPNSPYNEDEFLDYLGGPIAGRGAFRDSFKGLWRFNRFLKNIESEFSVCFSGPDRESNFSLDKFVERIAYLRENPRGSMSSLRNREKHSHVTLYILINIIGGAFLILSWNMIVLLSVVVAVLGIINGFLIWISYRDRECNKRLRVQIDALGRKEVKT